MIRIAALADPHFGADSTGTLAPHLEDVAEHADLLLIGGDLTKVGLVEEASVLAAELKTTAEALPVFTVLGNHDHHSDQQERVRGVLEGAGIRVLEGQSATVDVSGTVLGVAGVKGFGGGFPGASGSDFGEQEMKAFIWHTRETADALEKALDEVSAADHRVALMHYSPIRETLVGEPPEIYPFLGSYLLAEAVDRQGADLVLHGHAHRGTEKGATPGGIHVRNCSQHVIRHAYNVYCLGEDAA
jgi:Icc-related predicted phosphoesterase